MRWTYSGMTPGLSAMAAAGPADATTVATLEIESTLASRDAAPLNPAF